MKELLRRIAYGVFGCFVLAVVLLPLRMIIDASSAVRFVVLGALVAWFVWWIGGIVRLLLEREPEQ